MLLSMHALQYLLCLLCFTVGANNNDTFPKPVLDLIYDYSYYFGWYTTNNYARYEDDKRHDKQKGDRIHLDLEDMVVPGYMDSNSLSQLLHLIRAKGWETHDHPSEGRVLNETYRQNVERNIRVLDATRERFKQSSFGPSEKMIGHIVGLAESHVWRPVNERAGKTGQKKCDDGWCEHHYVSLLARNLEIVKMDFEEDASHWTDGPPDSQCLETVSNEGGSEPLTSEVTISTSKVNQTSFSNTMSVSLGFKIYSGVDIGVVKSGYEFSVDFSYSETWGSMEAKTNGVSRKRNCIAAPGETVECRALWKTRLANIPYVITYRVDRRHEIKVNGIWKGVVSYDGYVSKKLVNNPVQSQSA